MTLGKLQEMAETGGQGTAAARSAVKESSQEPGASDIASAQELERQMTQLFKSVTRHQHCNVFVLSVPKQFIYWLYRLRLHPDDLYQVKPILLVNERMKPRGAPVFFIHSIEGIASPIKPLCEQLAFPVWCLQTTDETPQNSIEAMAEHYIRVRITAINQAYFKQLRR